MVIAHAVTECQGHFLSHVFLAPLVFYGILAVLIEWGQRHHLASSKHMHDTWEQIEALRERSNVRALFTYTLQRKHLEGAKILGSRWADTLKNGECIDLPP